MPMAYIFRLRSTRGFSAYDIEARYDVYASASMMPVDDFDAEPLGC